MASKPNFDRPRSSKASRSGFEKMQMGHRRTREQIQRIQVEHADVRQPASPSMSSASAVGKPFHVMGRAANALPTKLPQHGRISDHG